MKLSIITVTYNSAATLPATIDSVLAQQDVDLEYIIVDGTSTDGTVAVIQDFAMRDSRIRWISEPDGGIYAAMNKGWAMAGADRRILFLGSGDRLLDLPINNSDIDSDAVIYGDVESGPRFFYSRVGPCLKYSNTLHHQSLLIPKHIHPAPPFDTDFKIYADFDFNQRLYGQGTAFLYNENLRTYFDPDGVSSRKNRCEIFRVIKKNFGVCTALVALLLTPFRQRCWHVRD